MPHAVAVPPAGFQALVLCGPGASLNTFTSTPDEFPKALVPIANRPMVWYPLEWCYRMGITKIHLITPHTSSKAIAVALSQNSHLSSLPQPKAEILAPTGLLQTSGTAEILRHQDVQAVITGDFLVLPCDLICEIPGESLLEAWMIQQPGLAGSLGSPPDSQEAPVGGEQPGGLGVWYQTKTENSTKGVETDFVITTALLEPTFPPCRLSIQTSISNLVYATTTDTLRDTIKEKEGFLIRQGLLRKHSRIRLLTTHRDAHIYIFPRWVLDLVSRNEKFDSISEDVLGWWGKATWQDGLAEKIGLTEILTNKPSPLSFSSSPDNNNHTGPLTHCINIASLSTTQTSNLNPAKQQKTSAIPPILAYIHPSGPPSATHLIRRVDTTPTLLTTSLYIATLPPSSHPLSHPQKIHPSTLIPPRTTVNAPTVLLAAEIDIGIHTSIKESVIGSHCIIGQGAKILRCVIMDKAHIGEKCVLTGCVIGPGANVGERAVLRDVEVQGGFVVDEGVVVEGEKMMSFEGLGEVEDEDEDEDDGDGHERGGGGREGEDAEI